MILIFFPLLVGVFAVFSAEAHGLHQSKKPCKASKPWDGIDGWPVVDGETIGVCMSQIDTYVGRYICVCIYIYI